MNSDQAKENDPTESTEGTGSTMTSITPPPLSINDIRVGGPLDQNLKAMPLSNSKSRPRNVVRIPLKRLTASPSRSGPLASRCIHEQASSAPDD
jgi:hypothetical protein